MDRKKILFVEDELEDNPEENEVWLGLKEHGYEVTAAKNGQQAWGYLAAEKFDLILLDIMLPPNEEIEPTASELSMIKRMDMGLHLLKKLRSRTFERQGTSAQVSVVVVSAVPGVDRWKKLVELVGNERWCLAKPCSPLEVVAAIKEALG